ncbi:MAG TPA: dihydroorotase [Burkholderiaceae bacterium]|nr:dihydroorotase [Burkholderiaceae bacterium]
MQTLAITRPDDWHLHLRDGPVLKDALMHTSGVFARAIVMPNLRPPVTRTEQALAYRERILAALPTGHRFEPLMTLYLTDATPAAEVRRAHASGLVHAVKLYPSGATTHSESGVTDPVRCAPALEAMQALDLPLLVHGESTDPAADVFDRERAFIDSVLLPLRRRFPSLRIVFEHITTCEAVQCVQEGGDRIAATITAHHLRYSRNALFVGPDGRNGIRPHLYCLPVLKREMHRQALLRAATGGSAKFFLGTDSAPHAVRDKESACGCAGCFTAPVALPMYADCFEQAGALDRLEAFASFHGADFYRLPRNRETITLRREPWQAPADLAFGAERVVPLGAGETFQWKLAI